MRYAQPPPDTYATKPHVPSDGQTDLSAPPTFNTPPPSGYSPAPFMVPASTGSGPPPTSVFPGSTGQPSGAPSFAQGPPSGMMVPGSGMYQAVRHHWCYRKMVEGHEVWYTFSRLDSSRLEEQFSKGMCVCLLGGGGGGRCVYTYMYSYVYVTYIDTSVCDVCVREIENVDVTARHVCECVMS